jgi:hypothetical protein
VLFLTVTSFFHHDDGVSAFTPGRIVTSIYDVPSTTTTTTTPFQTPSKQVHVIVDASRNHNRDMGDPADGDEEDFPPMMTMGLSRRSCLSTATIVVLGALSFGVVPVVPNKDMIVWAADDEFGVIEPSSSSETMERSTIKTLSSDPSYQSVRTKLLQLIQTKNTSAAGDTTATTEKDVLALIDELVQYDPTKGKGATYESDLNGEWKLLWSAKAEAFSPLLKLPPPFTPMSYQYLGDAAASEVGSGRVAQGLTGGALLRSNQLWLSSGVRPSIDDPSVLEILPPFRFELGGPYQSGRPKKQIVEAGSDAEFRKYNARTVEAQAAPKNSYKQLYLEQIGKGSIRISTITEGDPVIVGAIFIHEKM